MKLYSGMGWALVLLLSLGVGQAEAQTDVFRADFNNVQVLGTLATRIGSFSACPQASSVLNLGGFSGISMRLAGDSSIVSQYWYPGWTATVGTISFHWDMNIGTAPTGTQSITMSPTFNRPYSGTAVAKPIQWQAGSNIVYGGEVFATQFQSGVISHYQYDVDLDRGWTRLWVDGTLVTESSSSSILDGYGIKHIQFMLPAGYNGYVYFDNIQVVNSQPMVPLINAGFDQYPDENLSVGPLNGYPVEDDVTLFYNEAPAKDVLALTNYPASYLSRKLWMRHGADGGDYPYLAFTFAGNQTNPPPGYYMARYTVQPMGDEGAIYIRTSDGASTLTHTLLFNGQVMTSDSNFSYYVSPAWFTTNESYAFVYELDTLNSTYDFFMGGNLVATNYRLMYEGRSPDSIRVGTYSNATQSVYFEGFSLQREGREGLYMINATYGDTGQRDIQKYDTASRAFVREQVVDTNNPVQIAFMDLDFGKGGYLYALDSGAQMGLRVYDPTTLEEVDHYQDAELNDPYSLACFRNGNIAILDDGDIHLYSGYPGIAYITTLVHSVSGFPFWIRLNKEQDKLLAISAIPDAVYLYDVAGGDFIKEMASVAGISPLEIQEGDVGPDGRLYLLDINTSNMYTFAIEEDVYTGTFCGEMPTLAPYAFGFLNNGDMVVVSFFTGRMVVIDGYTEDVVGDFITEGASFLSPQRIVTAPPLSIIAMEPNSSSTIDIQVDGDFGRYYSVFHYTNLMQNGWLPWTTNQFAGSSQPVIPYWNAAPNRARFMRVSESGFN